MGWPLEARRSLFPDWPWLCDESSSYKRALHIPVQILAGKFIMEVLPTISLTQVFPVAQICPNLHKIVPIYALLEKVLCEFGQICATGNVFVRLTAGRVSFLKIPAKI